jgi:hypothetical protein
MRLPPPGIFATASQASRCGLLKPWSRWRDCGWFHFLCIGLAVLCTRRRVFWSFPDRSRCIRAGIDHSRGKRRRQGYEKTTDLGNIAGVMEALWCPHLCSNFLAPDERIARRSYSKYSGALHIPRGKRICSLRCQQFEWFVRCGLGGGKLVFVVSRFACGSGHVVLLWLAFMPCLRVTANDHHKHSMSDVQYGDSLSAEAKKDCCDSKFLS